MRLALFVLALTSPAATLTIAPPVIYDCTGTYGKATVRWNGATGPVQVLVGPSKAVFTGFGNTSGSAETGTWVGNGLEFHLANRRGEVEASAVAQVICDAPTTPANGMVSDSYFPLEIGNRWVYRIDSRASTSNYLIWTVTGRRVHDGRVYAEITSEGELPLLIYLREENGSFYQWIGRDELYLNPASAQPVTFRNALGSYPDAISQTTTQSLVRQSLTFVRGIGLARLRADLLTGSSGGFLTSYELIEFRLATGPRVEAPVAPKISLSIEKTWLNVTGKELTNCAIPCYYAACGLGSPVDPPGTYKPCVRVRIEAASEGDFQTELTLLGPSSELFRSQLQSGSGETVRYIQLPLYGDQNQPLPAGRYVVMAHMKRDRSDVGSSQLLVDIR